VGGVLRCSALTLLLLVSASAAHAGAGTADLLIIPSPGFAGQMRFGCAGAALADGPAAIDGNPAAISPGFAASGGRWNLGTTGVAASGTFRIADHLLAGLGARYLGRSGLVERDETGAVTGEYSFSSGIASIGASRGFGGGFSAGASVGIVWEDVGEMGATGFTTSAGVRLAPSDRLEMGAVVRGLGSSPSWNGIHKDMPTEVSAGARYRFGELFSLFGGARYGFDTPDAFCLGLELTGAGFSLSGGWEESPGEDEVTGLFGGLGYTYVTGEVYRIEMAVSQRDRLDWPVVAGLSVLF